eukprot:1159312-Pelagomonas_calceolata.AAC.6
MGMTSKMCNSFVPLAHGPAAGLQGNFRISVSKSKFYSICGKGKEFQTCRCYTPMPFRPPESLYHPPYALATAAAASCCWQLVAL